MEPLFSMENAIKYMDAALCEASLAADSGEIPVGCVIVDFSGKTLAKSHNTREKELDVAGHAEIKAINLAAKATGSLNLSDCALFVTLEPCPMCKAAIAASGIKAVFCGAGATSVSGENSVSIKEASLPFELYRGILGDRCEKLLKDFFENKIRR